MPTTIFLLFIIPKYFAEPEFQVDILFALILFIFNLLVNFSWYISFEFDLMNLYIKKVYQKEEFFRIFLSEKYFQNMNKCMISNFSMIFDKEIILIQLYLSFILYQSLNQIIQQFRKHY